MQYCNKSLIKNNNEILQYFNKNNDIALVMHQRALLDMSDWHNIDWNAICDLINAGKLGKKQIRHNQCKFRIFFNCSIKILFCIAMPGLFRISKT